MKKLKHTNLYNTLFKEIIAIYESDADKNDGVIDDKLCILFNAMQAMLQIELPQYDLNKYDCWHAIILNYNTFEQFYINEINL